MKDTSLFSLIMIFLACGLIYPIEGRPMTFLPAYAHAIQETAKAIKLNLAIESEHYCVEMSSDYSYTKLRLVLKLTVTNVSNQPVIINRYGGDMLRVLLSKKHAQPKARQYVYDEHISPMRPRLRLPDRFFDKAPTSEFAILNPGDSLTYQFKQREDITLEDLAEPRESLRSGDYLLEIRTRTWPWELERVKEIQRRWLKFGVLWYYDVTSEPMQLRIAKPGSITVVCEQ